MPYNQTKSAVLFLVFNRPDTTKKVFEAIKAVKPPRLYIAADGPRINRLGELEKVKSVREIVSKIDWDCEVKTLFREENLGCKYAVSSAITWFFEHEEQGIILEDDCLPNSDFFWFCDEMLNRYKYNDYVWTITGDNYQNGFKRGDGSYYFSRYNHVWGWASWSRSWAYYDVEIGVWNDWKNSAEFKEYFSNKRERNYWLRVFDDVKNGKIDTWDYQWTLCLFRNNGLTVTPNVNLVENIGFGEDATHTKERINADLTVHSIGNITHPSKIERNISADDYVFNHLFNPPYSLLKKIFFYLYKNIIRKLG
jgi:hypothetical protein